MSKFSIIARASFFFMLCVCLQACTHKEEFTEYTPAKLELEWSEEISRDEAVKAKHDLSQEMKQKLLKIGDFNYSNTISITSEKSLLKYKILFLREIKTEEALELAPLITEICKGKQFAVTSHGAITKKTVRETTGFSFSI